MSTSFEIVDFYNGGAQVEIPAQTVDMTHTFSGGADADAEPTQIGYEPKANSKLADGAAYDEIKHDGQRWLLLKGGYIYAVKFNSEQHVVSAEEGHIQLPIPKGAHVEVDEYDEELHGVAPEDGDDEDAVGDDEDDAADEEE
jgi:hypothetical protein